MPKLKRVTGVTKKLKALATDSHLGRDKKTRIITLDPGKTRLPKPPSQKDGIWAKNRGGGKIDKNGMKHDHLGRFTS